MNQNDYVKFLTEEMVKYMQLSKEEKKQRKQEKPSRKSSVYWFGLIPLAIRMFRRKRKISHH
ncbi:YqzE family protein [Halobacillus litoralis]|uniref:YqzE family protein n=1 Tax=Halobacillus litoralis TaxID=45668 RepID=A0A845DQS7_9BACI|nr:MULTISPECIES: YqzE family protein [Halobacillus]MCA1023016.1 YqzE family protein [Halobacillus litoralis]MYL19756.1 YqzE family protein [Halobacillus litoralis]MYL28902.1 YqzE family protein [Halobacillus halophilus]